MILELRIKNCYSFSEQVIFSMLADMRSKRFSANLVDVSGLKVLKTAGIYGPNNSGKTCLIKCIRAIKNILMGQAPNLMKNMFSDSDICELGVTFAYLGAVYSYDFKYDVSKSEFIFEEFAEITYDAHKNEKRTVWLSRDLIKNTYVCNDETLKDILSAVAKNNLVCYLIQVSKFKCLAQIKEIITGFASKIDIVNMNNIPMQRTIDLLKNENKLQTKVVEFIKNADMYLEDYSYADAAEINVTAKMSEEGAEEKVLNLPENIMDQIRLVSVYKGVPVPSMIYDSTGTKKMAALASYVIESLEQGKILVVDELDNSIHFKLTRAIAAMFNNELNTNTQLIFTVHDINLMDCKKLFRKEQIWFVHKDSERVYLYPLSDFTAEQGIRETTDIIEKYRKGVLGALPDPELINTLLSIKSNRGTEEKGQ